MALLPCFFALGCAGEGDDAGGPPDTCDLLQTQCTGNGICLEGACVGFDRSYEVDLAVFHNSEQCRGGRVTLPNCLHPRATVYFNGSADPILGEPDSPDVAEIDVTADRDSYLLVDLVDRECRIEADAGTPEEWFGQVYRLLGDRPAVAGRDALA
jgi:hypothetical protein